MKNLFKTHFLLVAFAAVMAMIGIYQMTTGTFVSVGALFMFSLGFFAGTVILGLIIALPIIFLRAI